MSESYSRSPSVMDSNSVQSNDGKDTMFVGWVPGSENVPRKTAPRLHHKKSRTGCQQCRARRVKCNEVHPVCGSCTRHQTTCVWGRPPPASKPEPSKPKTYDIRPKVNPRRAPARTETIDLTETTERRLLELRLLHQYMSSTCWTLNLSDDPLIHEWSINIPQLALNHNALLYAILTVAALHIAKNEPNSQTNINNYQRYLGLALKEHRDEVANLSRFNADSACCTSNFIRVCAFAVLQERSWNSYEPPIHWLQMTSGAGRVFPAALQFITSLGDSVTMRCIQDVPGIKSEHSLRDKDVLFRASNRHGLEHLLRRTPMDEVFEPWDNEIRAGYECMVSYIGAVLIAISECESENNIFRRLLMFPMMCEKRFIDMVIEQRPRSLVVLAHFFALLTRFRDFWWIGDTGPSEVRGIESILPEEWLDLMRWPLQAVEDVFVQS